VSRPDGIWAVVPVKEFARAKQRLAGGLAPEERRALGAAMLEDVLGALAAVTGLAGILVVTVEPMAAGLAARYGACVRSEGARDGHTAAVTGAARFLAGQGRPGMITVPGDVPALTAAEVQATLAAHRPAPAFTIVPAHDDLGSNAIVCSPPDAVALRFGENSFFPHLDAARRHGIVPTIVRRPGIAMDIDHPADLAQFLRMGARGGSRTRDFLERTGLARQFVGM
jgi:2-phospho-L-lactate guanylyltransferase